MESEVQESCGWVGEIQKKNKNREGRRKSLLIERIPSTRDKIISLSFLSFLSPSVSLLSPSLFFQHMQMVKEVYPFHRFIHLPEPMSMSRKSWMTRLPLFLRPMTYLDGDWERCPPPSSPASLLLRSHLAQDHLKCSLSKKRRPLQSSSMRLALPDLALSVWSRIEGGRLYPFQTLWLLAVLWCHTKKKQKYQTWRKQKRKLLEYSILFTLLSSSFSFSSSLFLSKEVLFRLSLLLFLVLWKKWLRLIPRLWLRRRRKPIVKKIPFFLSLFFSMPLPRLRHCRHCCCCCCCCCHSY